MFFEIRKVGTHLFVIHPASEEHDGLLLGNKTVGFQAWLQGHLVMCLHGW
jgi:hypothetical protein